jgi:hypothetical protein
LSKAFSSRIYFATASPEGPAPIIAIRLTQKEPGDRKSDPISSDSGTRPKKGAISRFLARGTLPEDRWPIYQTTEEIWNQNSQNNAKTIITSKSKSDMRKQREREKTKLSTR